MSKKNTLINFYTIRHPTEEFNIGHSLIISDGQCLQLLKFPEKVTGSDFNPFSKLQVLKYAKKENSEKKEAYKIQETPISIAASQHHYFILHKDCLTILSTIDEGVVAYYEGVLLF